jgi:hypothetical protein
MKFSDQNINLIQIKCKRHWLLLCFLGISKFFMESYVIQLGFLFSKIILKKDILFILHLYNSYVFLLQDFINLKAQLL